VGLKSYLIELRDTIVRDPLPPNRVAAGWALGMFVGCSVPFGLQLIVSVPIAVLTRVSKIGATVGTLITNPFTIAFIYPVQTWVGSRLIGAPLTWEYTEKACARLGHVSLFSAEGWATLSDVGARVLGGFFAGGLLLALVMTPPTFWAVRHIIVKARAFRSSFRKGGPRSVAAAADTEVGSPESVRR